MKKIPFDLDKWLADKSQKVVTRSGRAVEILSTNMRLEFQPTCIILAKFDEDGFDKTMTYNCNGRAFGITDSDYDLFLVTDEPMTEFEDAVKGYANSSYYAGKPMADEDVKYISSKLLAIAKKQLKAEGWEYTDPLLKECLAETSDDSGQLEKEIDKEWKKCEPIDEGMGLESANIVNEQFNEIAHYFYNLGKVAGIKQCATLETDWINNIDPTDVDKAAEELYPSNSWKEGKVALHMINLHCQKAFKQGVTYGKAEALKDLPKWKKVKLAPFNEKFVGCYGEHLIYNGYMIHLSDLEKLPKEE